jgi:hypothetical protein
LREKCELFINLFLLPEGLKNFPSAREKNAAREKKISRFLCTLPSLAFLKEKVPRTEREGENPFF